MRSQSAHVKAQPSGRLINVRVSLRIWDAVDQLTQQHRTSKTAVIVALLEAGLRVWKKKVR